MTPDAEQVLAYIREHTARHGQTPGRYDIMAGTGINDHRITQALVLLQRLGHLRYRSDGLFTHVTLLTA